MKKPLFCFIDDSPFELDLMRYVIAPQAPDVDFVCTKNFDDCHLLLTECGGLYPALFILDLYGSDREPDPSLIPPKAELEAKTRTIRTLDDVYDGLDDLSGNEKLQEYMKRLFSVVNDWRTLHADVYNRLGHGTKYGKTSFELAQKHYPHAAKVFYTRKSTIEDAIDVFRLEPDGLMLKPTGHGAADIAGYTKEKAPELLRQWNDIVGKKYAKLLGTAAATPDAAIEEFPDMIPELRTLAHRLPNGAEYPAAFKEELYAWLDYIEHS